MGESRQPDVWKDSTAVDTTNLHEQKNRQHGSDIEESPTRTGWFHWHEPGTSKAEKKLIFKLDWFLLSYGCLCFFIKQLDGNNVSNAYVSGMSEELNFGKKNELSWMNTYFSIGTILGGPVSNLALTQIRPRYWLPSCLLVWSLFVLFLYKCNHASQFYGLRFSIGFFESAAWPGIQYILGCWYKKSELATRSGLFVMSGVLGQMFSGYLQSALYKGMGGKGGLSAWRWLFIFDFILAIPVALYGFIFLPDTPENTTAFYLNEWERTRAIQRIDEDGRTPSGKMDLSVLKRIFQSWQLYTFSLAYAFWSLTCGSYVMQYFELYLKSLKTYSVPQINNIPTCIGAVNFFFMIGTGFISDKIGRRGPVCFAVGCLMTFCYAVFTAWPASHSLKMAAFILTGCYGCYTPLLAGWVNGSCGGDQQLRAFVLAFMVSLGGAVVIPFQQYQLPSGKAPTFAQTHGWASALAFVVALTLWTGFGIDFVKRIVTKNRQPEKENDV
ncbi:Major facilitator superfamily domain general substrate transporter [Penicillium taxi]|uniref:Major facilitator superfamily domain general substrate transporter n=1 Tax=Penicillium taxi TaxID=168475 RepID=UPI002545612A|nr:Major facilitator superfamily domain general substrate transporter [Penicillium taxi]KAJ5893855.1 Major facilitator superfamily domain general substrate transporter [Penicillium taxi]